MAKKIETKEDEINELEKIEEEEAKVEKKKGKKKKSEDDGAESEEKSEEQEETLEKEDSKEPSENEDEKSQNADEESLEEKIKKKMISPQEATKGFLSRISGQKGVEKKHKDKLGKVLNAKDRYDAINKVYKRIYKREKDDR